jgi:hypothetical protein
MKLLILFGLILIGFAIYTFFTSGAVSVQKPQHTIIQPYQQEQIPLEQPIHPQVQQRVIETHDEPGQYDVNESMQKGAGEMDTMRHPEYMFRPAPENNNVNIAAESGSASMISQMQQYRPDFVQNGGEFMDNVIPASSIDDMSFSSFN